MRCVVEQHKPSPHGILEVNDIQARRRLVEAIAIAACVEAEEAAEQQPQRRLVGDHQQVRSRVQRDEFANHRQCSGEHRHARLAASRRKRKRIGLPLIIFPGELVLDLLPLQAFPVAVADFTQSVARDGLEVAVARDDVGGVERTRQRTRINMAVLLRQNCGREVWWS